MNCFRSDLLFAAGVLCISAPLNGQDARTEVGNQLKRSIEQARTGGVVEFLSVEQCKAYPETVLALLDEFAVDPMPRIRGLVCGQYWRVGNLSSDRTVRRSISERLLRMCDDPSPGVWQQAYRFLHGLKRKTLEREDYSDASLAQVRQLFHERPRRRYAILLVGHLKLHEELPALAELLIDDSDVEKITKVVGWYGGTSWHARLARARMGVEDDIDRVIELVDKEPNPIVKVGTLLPFLGYTRQPKVFSYVATFLDGDGRMPACKPPHIGPAHAQYAMHVLAQHASDFPVAEKNVGGYTDGDIARAKEWAKKLPE